MREASIDLGNLEELLLLLLLGEHWQSKALEVPDIFDASTLGRESGTLHPHSNSCRTLTTEPLERNLIVALVEFLLKEPALPSASNFRTNADLGCRRSPRCRRRPHWAAAFASVVG